MWKFVHLTFSHSLLSCFLSFSLQLLLSPRYSFFLSFSSGKLSGLALQTEVEVMKGVFLPSSSSGSHQRRLKRGRRQMFTLALLQKEEKVRRKDKIIVYSCADLTNYQVRTWTLSLFTRRRGWFFWDFETTLLLWKRSAICSWEEAYIASCVCPFSFWKAKEGVDIHLAPSLWLCYVAVSVSVSMFLYRCRIRGLDLKSIQDIQRPLLKGFSSPFCFHG